MAKLKNRVFKTLSRNDTGETKSHQVGVSIPKAIANPPLFPKMSKDILNQKVSIVFYDEKGNPWNFNYTYYNDIYHGKPKEKGHDEFRLTVGFLKFVRENNVHAGDKIWFGFDEYNNRRIGVCPKDFEESALLASNEVADCGNKGIVQETETDEGIQDIYSTKAAETVSIDDIILDPFTDASPILMKINKNWNEIKY